MSGIEKKERITSGQQLGRKGRRKREREREREMNERETKREKNRVIRVTQQQRK